MTYYTNPHTFKQYFRVCIKKSIKLRLSYAFADFRNIAQRAKLCKTVQNVPNSLYSFKWKTRAYLWMVEIRCWKFLTNFIPKYHCATPMQVSWDHRKWSIFPENHGNHISWVPPMPSLIFMGMNPWNFVNWWNVNLWFGELVKFGLVLIIISGVFRV